MEIREKINASGGFFYTVKSAIAARRTEYQMAEAVETDFLGKALILDGRMQVTERWENRYHEPLVHPPLLIHPNPKRVLLIGGGDGGSLREILKHRSVEKVDFAELDPGVISFCEEFLPSIHQNAFQDPRVSFHYGDGRKFVENCRERYDVIIMDMTDPEGPSTALYTREFFLGVQKLFRDSHSCFAMHGESPIAWPEAFACIGATLSSVFAKVSTALCFTPMYGTLWSFRYASDSAVPASADGDIIQEIIAQRLGETPRVVNRDMWPALFAEDPAIAEAESHAERRVITDEDPVFPGGFSV